MKKVQSVLSTSRADSILDVDFRSEEELYAEEIMKRIRPKQAINSDASSYDSEEDEELRHAKQVVLRDNSLKRKSMQFDNDFSSESEY